MKLSLFFFVYYFVATLFFILFLPVIFILSFKTKYKDSIPSRFFLKNNSYNFDEQILFHVCSLGEAKSIAPIFGKIKSKKSITVITQTGFEEAKRYSSSARFLPFEIFLPFLFQKIKTLVVLEAELWFLLFWSAKRSGAKTILLNARISDNSYKNYVRFKFLYKNIFQNIDIVLCQSQTDKIRLEELGAKNIKIIGNIKTYFDIQVTKQFKKPQNFITVLASTHEGEEELILDKIKIEKGEKIFIVPRHPQRFTEVEKFIVLFCQKNNFSFSKFSQSQDFNTDIVLVDAIGELINIYAIADLVILGGSFVQNVGGHNPIEPAFFHTKLVSGKYIFNQKTLFEAVENINIVQTDELEKVYKDKNNLINSSIIKNFNPKEVLEEIEWFCKTKEGEEVRKARDEK